MTLIKVKSRGTDNITGIGKNLRRPQDYKDPDPARSYLVSDSFFDDLDKNDNLFEK